MGKTGTVGEATAARRLLAVVETKARNGGARF